MIPELWLLAGALVGISIGAAATILITAKRYCEAAPMDRKELDELRATLGDDSGVAPSSNMAGASRRAEAPTQPIYPANFACGECD